MPIPNLSRSFPHIPYSVISPTFLFFSSPSFRSKSTDGETFTESYVLQHQLGDGGTAAVWSGVSRSTGTLVAVKIASRQQGMRWSRAVRTFEHEAAMLQRCQHEHVVRQLALFQGPRDLALTLELLPGGDVQQLLQRHGALAEAAVGAIIRQLSLALLHVHKCGVLHRDVKLENLLVVRPGASPIIKLCDFGHAAYFAHADDGFTGTVGYAAPEAAGMDGRAPEWSAAADAWSTGVVMYAMLANAPLQWARDGPDFSSRPLQQTSMKAKLLIRSLLSVAPLERAYLDHACAVLASQPKTDAEGGMRAAGLRRGLGSLQHSYSLLDISSLDREHVPRADVVLSNTPSSNSGLLSPSNSMDSMRGYERNDAPDRLGSRGSSSANLHDGSSSNSLQESGNGNQTLPSPMTARRRMPALQEGAALSSATATAAAASAAAPSGASPNASPPPAAAAAASSPLLAAVFADADTASSLPGHGFTCIKTSPFKWRGTYERRLHIDEAGRRILTVDPSTNRVTNTWAFDRILAVLPDESVVADEFAGSSSTAAASDATPPNGATPTNGAIPTNGATPTNAAGSRLHGFSLLVDGGAPSLLCLGGFLTPRLRFSAPEAVRDLIVSAMRAALTAAPKAAVPAAAAMLPPASLPVVGPTPLQADSIQKPPSPLGPKGLAPPSSAGPKSVAPPSPLGKPLSVAPSPEAVSSGGVSPPVHTPVLRPKGAFPVRPSMGQRGMSCGNFDLFNEHSDAAQSSREQAAQEEQLRRMRERMIAIKSGSGLGPRKVNA